MNTKDAKRKQQHNCVLFYTAIATMKEQPNLVSKEVKKASNMATTFPTTTEYLFAIRILILSTMKAIIGLQSSSAHIAARP